MKTLLIFTFCLIIAATDAVTTVTGYRGRSVQIKCPYHSGYEENNKYLCRGQCPYVGHRDIPVHSGSPAEDTRFSLSDDKTAKVFTVTITDLRPEDENTYWCGIQRAGTDIYTEILLVVKTDVPAISTASPTTHTAATDSTTGSPLNNADNPSNVPSSQEFPTTTVILATSVVLVLLLIALLFAVALQRKKKARAKSPQGSSGNHVVPCPVYDYEEPEDSRRLSNTLYSTAQTPTIPSDFSQTIYSNTGLPTVPSDNSQAVYSTVHCPSDSPDQDIYSTAQLPTTLSASSVSPAPPSVVKPGESLTYAEVIFDTRSNAAAPTLIYRTENNSSDYATVHVTE